MPDDKEKLEQEKKEQETKEKEALALAEAKPTEKNEEHMIPKSRLDEEIKKLKDARDELDVLKKEQANQLDAQLVEQGKYKEIADKRAKTIAELQPVADQVESYEKTLTGVLDAQIEDLPEHQRDLVPSKYTTQQKLDWIAEHKSNLMKPLPPNLEAGTRGGGQNGKSVVLTAEQKEAADRTKVSHAEYAKNIIKE